MLSHRPEMTARKTPWPDGCRCACCLTFDIDSDSLIHLEHPEDGHTRASAISMLQYDADVAIPRIVGTYKRLGIRQTFFFPAWCMERYPRAVEAMLAGDNEIAQHGYLHENPQTQSREEQAYWLDRCSEVIVRMTGQRPRGWRAPLYNFSNHSAELLAERGFLYDASLMGDDSPYLLTTDAGRLIELPSHWGLDDWPQYVQSMDLDYMMPVRSPRAGFEIFRQEFEAAYKYGTLWVPVLHPFATGRLSRWDVVVDFLEEILGRGDVWFAPMEEIAKHVAGLIDAGVHVPRAVAMPQYAGPVRPQSPFSS